MSSSLRGRQSEQDTADILEDTRIACQKHGTLLHFFAPRADATPAPASGLTAEALSGRIFVRFLTAQAAAACALELHGREFEGRPVCACFVRDELYQHIKVLRVVADAGTDS